MALTCVFILLLIQAASLSRQQALNNLQQKTLADMNRYMLNLQQTLDRYKDLPRLLSTHSELINTLLYDSSNDAQMRANLYLEQVNDVIGASDTYLMNAQGSTVSASNWSKEASFVGRDFSFRPYFQDAIQGRAGRYFALGTTSKKRGYFFSYPVEHRGRIIGAVIVKIDLNEIETDWNDVSTDLVVSDDDGVIFISTRKDWKFHTLTPLAPLDAQRIYQSLRYGDYPLTSLDIIKRSARDDGSQLITLIDSGDVSNTALDGIKTGEYLLQSTVVDGAGFTVSILASMKPVQRQVLNAIMLAAFVYLAMVLLVMVIISRRRIVKERARFKQRELQALEKNESRIRDIIDNTQAGLITLDSEGRVDSFNRTAEKLFGYNEERVKHQYFSLFLSQEDRPVCWQHITQASVAEVPDLMIEASGKRQSGTYFPIEITIGKMQRGDVLRFVVTIHDITQRKEYELALQNSQAELESRVHERTSDLTYANAKLREEMDLHKNTQNELIQTAKLAVLGQMSAGINHELNQPLTAIRAYADNAQQFLKLDRLEPVGTNLAEISQLTERMAKIIHPLKEFARKTSGHAETVCMKSVKDGAMSIMYGRLSREQVSISWPSSLESCFVLGDIVRIEQVMVNLIANAIQAMESLEDKRIDITLESCNNEQALLVRDYGPGIPEDELGRVFEPFYTTKKAGQGLGLGLSISYRIIDSLGGDLSVSNHPQGGAVFRLSLPTDPYQGIDQQLTSR
ncbi:ATP-binding protein [Neptunomonas japonica]|uniref:C4-dicarboxylate transport sensor protein DctB n=1 Tax=Neptunomonas japonica JAMM 1380 TaxID=1441457 RepID=A0A7R6PRT5_9GAMM|nr:ATP-binding protein [Neptunomonas japonica]BBB31437.1 two-component system, NtrC family, C4-dicarboxylate transport sensor histidine kinase DctB [Neptunomonas japonica JAMM 1380]